VGFHVWTFVISDFHAETHDHERHKAVARQYAAEQGLQSVTPGPVSFLDATDIGEGRTAVRYSVPTNSPTDWSVPEAPLPAAPTPTDP
jgi:hypothetical protein